MTTHRVDGSRRVCSTFALRPPLPGDKTDYGDSFAGRTFRRDNSCDANEVEKGATSATTAKVTEETESVLFFRMYVACHVLRLATETRFTALVLLHRYMQAKQKAAFAANANADTKEDEEDMPWVGAVCLFLACKAEDEPRRLRDIINMAQMVLSSSLSNTTTATTVTNDHRVEVANDSSSIVMDMTRTPPLDGAYWDSKKKAIETEQMVLRWLGFDCSVSHPHRAVFWILDKLLTVQGSKPPRSSEPLEKKNLLETMPAMPTKRKHDDISSTATYKGDSDCNENNNATTKESTTNSCMKHDNGIRDQLQSMAFQRLNDALFYPRALQWGVVEMACAAIDLAVHSSTNATPVMGATYATAGHIPPEKHQNLDSNTNTSTSNTTTRFSIVKLIFKHEWWKGYKVSNDDFDDCRNNLKEATSYLKTMATTTDS